MERRRRRATRRTFGGSDVILTSVVDIMTIVLVFLLMSTTGDGVQVEPSADLELPISSAETALQVSVTIVATRRELILDGQPILAFLVDAEGVPSVPASALADGKIVAMSDKLRARLAAGAAPGQVLLQCDRRLPYDVIRDIMFTAGQSGFGDFRLVVVKGG